MHGNRYFHTTLIAVLLLTICGCSGSTPLTPEVQTEIQSTDSENLFNNYLWGYFNVAIDPETQTASANLNRHAMTTWNLVKAIDMIPASLSFELVSISETDEYWDVDVDVSITHPYEGVEKFNVYGVRGILMTDGATRVPLDNNLYHGIPGADQVMLTDPVELDGGGPDGYTRWFNPAEFYIPGLLGYYDGNFSSGGYTPTATLNPYKYFADGLGPQDDLWDFLVNTDTDGVFSGGATNSRNYYIRFPKSVGLKFSYAIAAVWDGPDNHPARVYDPVGVNVEITDELYYESSTQNGGYLHLDISIFDWGESLVADDGYGEYIKDFRVTVWSPIFSGVSFQPAPMVTGGGVNYSTCDVDISMNSIETPGTTYFLVSIRRWALDYSNDFGVHNLAASERLSAYFKYDLVIDEEHTNYPPHCSLYVGSPPPWTELPYTHRFDASGCSDLNSDDILTYEWDFDGDGIFNEDPDDRYTGSSEFPEHTFYEDYEGPIGLRVDDGHGGVDECSEFFDFNVHPKNNLPLRPDATAFDLAVFKVPEELLILYDDGQVWKYTYDGFYMDGAFFFQTEVGADRISISYDGTIIIGGNQEGVLEWVGSYDSAGNLIQEYSPVGRVYDVVGYDITTSDYYGFICDTNQPGFDFATYVIRPPLYAEPEATLKINGSGPGRLNKNLIVGIEAGSYSGSKVYILEKAPECSLECFSYDYADYYNTVGGVQSDFEGFWDPIDVTITNSNNFYVIDKLSTGETAIKKYPAYSWPETIYIDTGKISGEPLRIDSVNHIDSKIIFILHSNGLSILFDTYKNYI